MEEFEEGISNSSRSNSGNDKENKEVSHVSIVIVPRCVDLTKDQFPKMMDRIPSRVRYFIRIRQTSFHGSGSFSLMKPPLC